MPQWRSQIQVINCSQSKKYCAWVSDSLIRMHTYNPNVEWPLNINPCKLKLGVAWQSINVIWRYVVMRLGRRGGRRSRRRARSHLVLNVGREQGIVDLRDWPRKMWVNVERIVEGLLRPAVVPRQNGKRHSSPPILVPN